MAVYYITLPEGLSTLFEEFAVHHVPTSYEVMGAGGGTAEYEITTDEELPVLLDLFAKHVSNLITNSAIEFPEDTE